MTTSGENAVLITTMNRRFFMWQKRAFVRWGKHVAVTNCGVRGGQLLILFYSHFKCKYHILLCMHKDAAYMRFYVLLCSHAFYLLLSSWTEYQDRPWGDAPGWGKACHCEGGDRRWWMRWKPKRRFTIKHIDKVEKEAVRSTKITLSLSFHMKNCVLNWATSVVSIWSALFWYHFLMMHSITIT